MSCQSCQSAQSGGGVRKSNGHKEDCKCPICINIKHAKGGAGYDVDDNENNDIETVSPAKNSGAKKSNGHKANCGCPICKNMKKNSGSKNVTMKAKKSNGHKINCSCPICKNMKNKKVGGSMTDNDTNTSSSSDYDTDTSPPVLGGKRKIMKNGKKSNGHKINCGCPICKNMK